MLLKRGHKLKCFLGQADNIKLRGSPGNGTKIRQHHRDENNAYCPNQRKGAATINYAKEIGINQKYGQAN